MTMSTTSPSPYRDRTATLAHLQGLADELGSKDVTRDTSELAARVAEGRFFLATVGQFKRGKSTLLNALIGETLLPTGVAPVTSAITIIRYGPTRAAHVAFKNGLKTHVPVERLHEFVTEAANPQNEKGVAAVEVFHPAEVLAQGMCLVDTPGLGSVYHANTEETRAFVPHIDAALVVLGVDPPIGADEVALVQDVAGQVDQLLFVLNKVDRLSCSDQSEARRFTADILRRHLNRPDDRIFEVSATERLSTGPTRDWAALESRLRTLGSCASLVVDQAARRGIVRLGDRLSHHIAEHRDALVRPVEASERRIASLDIAVRRATQLLQDLAALFRSEEQRIVKQLFDTAQQPFAAWSAAGIESEVRHAVEILAQTQRPRALRQAAYAKVREIAVRRIRTWLADVEPRTESLYRRAAERFITLANEFLTSLTVSDEAAFERLPRVIEPEVGFRAPRQFYFTDLMHLTSVNPLVWLLDQLQPRSAAVRWIAGDATRYAERLLTSNSSRVIFDLGDRLSESGHALESELRFMLKEITTSASKALDQAKAVRDQGEAAIVRELERLEHQAAVLRELTGEAARDDHPS